MHGGEQTPGDAALWPGDIPQSARGQVWAALREASTLGKVGQEAELAHCRVPPRRCCPLPGLCEQRRGALVSLGYYGV